MGKTFQPVGNCRYCRENGLITKETIDGEEFDVVPFEMHLSGSNAQILLMALGLTAPFESGGMLNPKKILERLQEAPPEILLVRPATESWKKGQATLYDCGVTLAQVTGWYDGLKAICEEAIRREVDICYV